ncbi:transcriptional regulator ArgR [Fodinisporobacter ferrooxydans]|uniref:Arginine repressor n=1 Tax=Fodinisporobacter ferrooxydans TaxID=2901836 RepID=A0ABY4CLH3_9BACL|nr:transcriptional regulator ArgR [Alicyclobacillaceae bacterium MYW30-H2]
MKGHRLLKIRELITQHAIETQEELVDMLSELGFTVTQATVSRDIKELHLVKVPMDDGRYKYSLPAEPKYNPELKLKRLLMDAFVTIDRANNLIVIRMLPGNAQAVGALLDAMDWDIMGTIAGDDTILLICKTNEMAEDITERILNYL